MRSHQVLMDAEATATMIENTIEYRRRWQYKDVIAWLDPNDVQSDYERLKTQLLHGLGDWVLYEPGFKNWQSGRDNILWINGIPGCGKTMLMSMLLNNLFLLLSQNLDLAEAVFEMEIKSGQSRATSMTLVLHILRMLLDKKKTLTVPVVLIDALDECSDWEETRVLNELIALADQPQPKIRLLLSSRSEPGIRDVLKTYQTVFVTSEKTYADIKAYVDFTLSKSKLATLQQGLLLPRIVDKLTSKSNGQFLWAKLVLYELRKVTFIREIEDILDNTPSGLHKAYLRIFERLAREPSRRQETAISLFSWLACSERFLSLEEIECALALREGDQSLEPDARMIDLQSLLDDVCGSLVEVIQQSDKVVVRFVHFTIKEFLTAPSHVWETSDRATLRFRIDRPAAHRYLASTCLTQLSFPVIQQLPAREFRETVHLECPLLSYSTLFWAKHLSKSGVPRPHLLRQVSSLLESKNMEAYFEWSSQSKTTAQSITLIQSDLVTWVSKLSAQDPRVKVIINRFREYFEKTAQERSEIFGANSIEHMESLHQLATILHSSGSWQAAGEAAKQCLAGCEKLLGLSHPLTMAAQSQLGSLLRRLGKVEEAESLHTAVLGRRRQVLGLYHPDTFETEDELTTTMVAAKTFQKVCEAEQMSRDILLRKRRHYGKSHERTAATENILSAILKDKALALRAMKQDLLALETLRECEELCVSSMEVRQSFLGPDHPEVCTTWNMLGIVMQLLGRLEETQVVYVPESPGLTSQRQTIPSDVSHITPDPFGCFSIDLPLRSSELLSEFYRHTQGMDSASQERLAPATSDAFALRTTMLVAAFHHDRLSESGLSHFQRTYLHHKIQAIQSVNSWIAGGQPQLVNSIIRQVATLCFIEICFGDFFSAGAHLNGMVLLLEYQRRQQPIGESSRRTKEYVEDEELTDRYSLLIVTVYIRNINRIMHSLNFIPGSGDFWKAYREGLADISRPFDQVERNCDFDLKLLTLRMMPLFAKLPPAGTTFGWVSGLETIQKLRDITESIDIIRAKPVIDNEETRLAMSCANGVAAQLHVHHITSHVASLKYRDAKIRHDEWSASWCGLYITTGIYLHRVLGLRDPSEKTYQKYIVHVLKKAIAEHMSLIRDGGHGNRMMLLWQIVLGAMHVEMMGREGGPADHDPSDTDFFDAALRDWGQMTSLDEWSSAQSILFEIVWSKSWSGEDLLKDIWERAVEKV
ncbi:hypothetical protein FLONG3_4507 [Fusarium longipes]|uniref:Uncharacterized protein n=1 Tax=Fusarium longipes TaxID=694270 RepID=A0A395SZ17_9HYPO|nr:hypothetical protein FLONG3_4507 [Fusarium longipes]